MLGVLGQVGGLKQSLVSSRFPQSWVMSSQGGLRPFFLPTQLPTLSSFLALNIVSALDLDCIINGQSLERAAFGSWLCIKLLTQ